MVKSTTFKITPEWAKGILDNSNRNNRKPSVTTVSKYAKAMLQGEWKLNGQAIIVGKSGALLNGQHRLLACVKAGVPFEAVVTTGVDDSSDDVFATIDRGRVRSRGNILEASGLARIHSKKIAEASTYILQFQADPDFKLDHRSFSKELTDEQIMQAVRDNPGLVDGARLVNGCKRSSTFAKPNGLFIALWAKFGDVDPEARDRYFDELINGSHKGSPVHLLRDHIQMNPVHFHEDRRRVVSMAIKAFSALRSGKTYSVLRADSRIPEIK